MSSVIIVPGLHNSGPRHWQTLWQRRLPNAVRVEQDDWAVPNLTRWADNVAAVLNAVDDCWIVAHSFGCLASVRALAQAPGKVRGLLLVAPADPDKFSVAAQLPAQPLAINGRIIASRTDPWLSWTKAQQWAHVGNCRSVAPAMPVISMPNRAMGFGLKAGKSCNKCSSCSVPRGRVI